MGWKAMFRIENASSYLLRRSACQLTEIANQRVVIGHFESREVFAV
jgi:hypothetical protein